GDSASSTTPPTPTPTTTVESAPRLSATAKGKQPSRATTPIEPLDVKRTEAEQLKIVLRKSRQETHISQQRGSGIDEGTGSKPGVPNVPSDDSEEELSWNSSDDEDISSHEEGKKSDESDDDRDEGSDNDSDETVKSGAGKDDDDDDEDDDDNDEEEELAKDDEEDKETGKGGDEVRESEGESDEEETRQEEDENFDPIPRIPEKVKRKAMMRRRVESIFTTTSFPIVSLETPTPIMTPSTIATITTSGEAPIPPPTIPSIILENLPMFNSAFRFEERLRSLETSFSEYRQTNLFVDAVSVIPGIVHQYMTQQIKEAVREAVQIQTDWLQDSLQRENNEFLRNINENMKKVLKGLVKNQVKEQVSRILPQIEESVNATLETEILTRSSQSSKTSYAIAADLSEMELKKILIENMEGNNEDERMMIRKDPPLDQTGGLKGKNKETTCQMEETPHPVFETGADDQPIVQTFTHPKWFSQSRRPPSPDRAWNTTLPAARGDAQSWISDLARQTDARASFNELLDTAIDFSNFIMHLV
nr:hypothetical protein [Tanacetum cinerariifolium]